MIDADKIGPGIYQGGKPPLGRALRRDGFHVVVLCAKEYQPEPEGFIGVSVIRVPLPDDPRGLNSRQYNRATQAALKAADYVRRGAKVLVTCHAGLNRSGLVNVLTLCYATGCSGATAVEQVQRKREGALFNDAFVRVLRSIPASSPP